MPEAEGNVGRIDGDFSFRVVRHSKDAEILVRASLARRPCRRRCVGCTGLPADAGARPDRTHRGTLQLFPLDSVLPRHP